MNEFSFYDCDYDYRHQHSWLKDKDLVEGYVYIIKDGRIALYLGRDKMGKYCFYVCCNMRFKHLDSYLLSFANYDIQLLSTINMCNELFKHRIYLESVVCLKTIPKIYCRFPFVDFSSSYKVWYSKQLLLVEGLPVISSISNTKLNNGFVGAKDLIPGQLYYTGSCWRGEWVYLGRTSDKRFIWYFIGNEDILVHSSTYQLLLSAETTKSNKKVRLLSDALSDPDAYISNDCARLIKSKFKVDMTGITQQIIDKIFG